jgi:hypothetical protein
MAHYAFINTENIVVEIIVGKNENEGNIDWEDYYGEVRGLTCKRTSYNTHDNTHKLGGTPFRKNYAVIGGVYDFDLDAFYPSKPFESWELDLDTCVWQPPVPKPNDGLPYEWDEENQKWIGVPT